MKDNYNNYIRRVKRNGCIYEYTFVYDHSEDLTDTHIKSENPEYFKYSTDKRHVFYEDISLRKRTVFDPSAIQKRGRKAGSKDSYKRVRTCKSKEK